METALQSIHRLRMAIAQEIHDLAQTGSAERIPTDTSPCLPRSPERPTAKISDPHEGMRVDTLPAGGTRSNDIAPSAADGPLPPPHKTSAELRPDPEELQPAHSWRAHLWVTISATAVAALLVTGIIALATGILGDGQGDHPYDKSSPAWGHAVLPSTVPSRSMPHAPGAPSTPAQSRAGSDSAAAWQHPSAGTAFEKGNHGTASPSTRSGDNNPIEDPPDPPVLRQGDSGPEVVELQKRLRQSLCLCYLRGDVDGTYDSRVKSAVWSYQSIRGVHGDPQGVYGPNTRRALEAETSSPR